ncbi:MAG: hypothetical protein Q9160_004134 [Pyrenula sp. 1 TL-2023]
MPNAAGFRHLDLEVHVESIGRTIYHGSRYIQGIISKCPDLRYLRGITAWQSTERASGDLAKLAAVFIAEHRSLSRAFVRDVEDRVGTKLRSAGEGQDRIWPRGAQMVFLDSNETDPDPDEYRELDIAQEIRLQKIHLRAMRVNVPDENKRRKTPFEDRAYQGKR